MKSLADASSSPDLTPRMQKIMTVAASEAERTSGHRVVGTEHVLLALVGDPNGIAGQVLGRLGVTDEVRTMLQTIMTSEGYTSSTP